MALIFTPSPLGRGYSPCGSIFDDLFPPAIGSLSYACARAACAPPATGLQRSAAAALPARQPSLRLQPSFAAPQEPEIHITRTSDGVTATSPLGRQFTRQDISLELTGRDLTLTAFHPGTALWHTDRPAAYRQTLELSEHIEARAIRADIQGGLLRIFFPYRRTQQAQLRQQCPRRIVIQGPAPAPAPAPASAPAPAPVSVPARTPAPSGAAAALQTAQRCARPYLRHPRPQGSQAPLHCAAQASVRAGGTGWEEALSAAAARWQQQLQLHAQLMQQFAHPASPPTNTTATTTTTAAQRPQQPRAVPISSGSAAPQAAAATQQEAQQQPQERPASPASRASSANPASPASRASSPEAASPNEKAKGKEPASPEQVAEMERRAAAERAAARVAAGSGSDDDWEQADGSVLPCPLDS